MPEGVKIGTAYLEIVASAKGAVNQIQKDFGGAMPKAGREAGAALGGGIVGAAAKFAAPLAGLFAVDAAKDFLTDAIGQASDMNETVSKSRAIFGDQSAAIDKWANNAATQFGLTKAEALDASASFGDMFRQIGFSGGDAAKASQNVVQMATDLGSFNNLGTDDVLDKISGAMRGEFDSLQQIIPNISAARVEQEAMTIAGTKHAKSLTAQQKAQAVMNIIQKDGARAMGDFAKTSGGLANQQKILSAQVDTLKQRMGTALLPVVTRAAGALNGFVAGMQNGTGKGGQFVAFLRTAGSVLQTVGGFLVRNKDVIIPFVAALAAGVAVFKTITAVVRAYTAVQAALNFVLSANPIGIVIVAVAALVAGLIYAYKHSQTFRNIVNGAFSAVRKVAGAVISWLGKAVQAVVSFVGNNWKRLLPLLGGPIGLAVTLIRSHWGRITAAFRAANAYVAGAFKSAWDRLKTILVTPITTAYNGIKSALGKVRTVFSQTVSAVGKIWSGLSTAAKKPVSFIINTVINDGLIGAYNKIAGVVGAKSIGQIHVPGFHDGGWTGPGSKFQPAGVVHADEFVINKSSRRKIERDAPGLLDGLNGYAQGGLVGGSGRFSSLFASRLLMAQKIAGQQYSIYQRGFRPATSYSGTSHQGDAIDAKVNQRLLRASRQVGIAMWDRTGKGNWVSHMHGVPLPGAGHPAGSAVWQAQDYLRGGDGLGGRDNGPRTGFLGKIGEFLKSGFASVSEWFKNLVKDPLAKLGQITNSPFGQVAARVPHMVVEGMLSKLPGFANGGTLRPGWSVVGERGPELAYSPRGGEGIISNRQSAMASRGAVTGNTFYGYTPKDVVDELEAQQRHAAALNPIW